MAIRNYSFFITAYSLFCLFFIGLAFVAPLYAGVEYTETDQIPRFNKHNWDTIPHPKVSSFTVHEDGSAEGLTVTSVPFKQYTILDTDGIRVQRFEIQDHYHFIVQGEVAYSEAELSILLAKYSTGRLDSV